MSEFIPAITDAHRDFIEKQPVFFVATVADDGRIELSPRGMDGFRILGPNLVGYLEADAAARELDPGSGRPISLMICAVDQPSPVLRIHGRSRAIVPDDDEWDIAARPFAASAETGQIVMIGVERVEEGEWSGPSHAPERPQRADRHIQIDPDWVPAVLNFWLNEVGPDGWYDSSEEMDARLAHLFRSLWEAQRVKPASAFLADADTALAAIVLFDQFPRNMFRHEARAFATDPLALEIAKAALDRNYDEEFVAGAQTFFYLPLMHSENLANQERCVALFSKPGLEDNLKYANMHRDLIARFGRFPHRNKALGRETLPQEEKAVAQGAEW